MDKYYYLISQLPFLKFNEKTYLDSKMFLSQAAKWLNEKEIWCLERVSISNFKIDKAESLLVQKYKEFEEALRKELVFFRKKEESRNTFKVLKTDLLEGNPFEVEKNLLKVRWDYIEEQAKDHSFDLEALILYFLKLQILERLVTFDKEKGIQKFDSLCEVGGKYE